MTPTSSPNGPFLRSAATTVNITTLNSVKVMSVGVYILVPTSISNHKALRRLSYFPFTLYNPLPQYFLQLTHLDLIRAGEPSTPFLPPLASISDISTVQQRNGSRGRL
ncbi:hypothetical protein PTI98_011050 [Pleurotus ostreatus]|nr:hypothetical protein PTI98_011050 [Pleurotus ostreatus]